MRRVVGKSVGIIFRGAVRTILPTATSACGLALLAGTAWALPPVPTQPIATCDHLAAGKCYVVQSTTLTTSSSGAHHFNVCHSNDITTPSGWGGCDHIIKDGNNMPLEVQSPYTLPSQYLPPHPLRRAYRFRACDANDACTTWSSAVYISRDTKPPFVPGPTSVAGCVYPPGALSGCWVADNFNIKATAPQDDGGSGVDPDGYWACRSNDTDGWGGCNVTLSRDTIPDFPVTGNHRPGTGKRRAYRFRAKDNAGNKWSPWNTPLYVRRDASAPTVSAGNADPETWYATRTAPVSASDTSGGASANSGLKSVRYQWNNPLPANCSSGILTSNGAVLPAPSGDNTLHLCAVDWIGRVDHWSGQYRVAAQSFGLDPVEELPISFGVNPIGHNGYDPSVLLNASGTDGRAFVQKPERWGLHTHDAVVEYELNGMKVGAVTDGHAGWGCLPAQNPGNPSDPNNGSGGVDTITNPYAPGKTLAFYTRTPSDTFRGRAWLAYEESSGWTHIDKALLHPLYNEPLCVTGSGGCDNQCQIKMGVARVAARVVGLYYYLYLEVRISGATYPGVHLVGVFLMRVEKQSTPPYVQLATGKAQLYRRQDDTWHNLSYDAFNGYYVDFANLPGGQSYLQWRILGPITQLGNVEVTPWGEYIITYKDDADVKYTIATTPDFKLSSVIVDGSIMDLGAVNILRPNGPLYPNLYRKPDTAEYILFFTDWGLPGNLNSAEIQSARVLPAMAQLRTPVPAEPVAGEFTVSGWARGATGDADLKLKVDGQAIDYRSFAFWHDPPEPCISAPKAGKSSCPRREFSAGLDTSQLANGTHTLTVTITEQEREPRNVSMTIEVKN